MAPTHFIRHILITGDVDWQELTNHLSLKVSRNVSVRLDRRRGGVFVRTRTVRPLLRADFRKLMRAFPGITEITDGVTDSFDGSGKVSIHYRPGPDERERIAALAARLKDDAERGWTLTRGGIGSVMGGAARRSRDEIGRLTRPRWGDGLPGRVRGA